MRWFDVLPPRGLRLGRWNITRVDKNIRSYDFFYNFFKIYLNKIIIGLSKAQSPSLPDAHVAVPLPGPRPHRADCARPWRLLLPRLHERRNVRGPGDHQRVLPARGDRQGAAGRCQERRQEDDSLLRRLGVRHAGADAQRQLERRAGDRLCARVRGDRDVIVAGGGTRGRGLNNETYANWNCDRAHSWCSHPLLETLHSPATDAESWPPARWPIMRLPARWPIMRPPARWPIMMAACTLTNHDADTVWSKLPHMTSCYPNTVVDHCNLISTFKWFETFGSCGAARVPGTRLPCSSPTAASLTPVYWSLLPIL